MRLISILLVATVLCLFTTTVDARPCGGSCVAGYDSAAVAAPVAAVVRAPVKVAAKVAVLPLRVVKAALERTRARDRKPVRRVLGKVLCRRCG